MKGLIQESYGPPKKVVKLVEMPEPTPDKDGVVVEVEAAPVHLADLKFINGEEGFRWFDMPRYPGHEGIGIVVAKGSTVTQFDVGDRVFLPLACGSYRQRVAVPASPCIPAPAGDAQQLCLTSLNGMTAYILLEDFCPSEPGSWVVQNGANSSCGRYLISMAKAKGIRTVNIVRRNELIDELKDIGADIVLVDSGDPDHMAAQVKAATGEAKMSVGIDCVASTATATIARCLAQNGTVVSYGFMTGENCQIAFQDLFNKGIRLVGMNMHTNRSEAEYRKVHTQLAQWIAKGTMSATIAAAYNLSQSQDAFAHELKTGTERMGKIVILPNG